MTTTPATGARPSARAFCLLTFALSWSLWLGGWWLSGRPDDLGAMKPALFAGSFAPGIVAALLMLRQGRAAFADWLRGFVRFRAGWRTYAAALLPLPLAMCALTALFGYDPVLSAGNDQAALFWLTLFPVSILNALAQVVMGAGPLGEEGGWRGYLLPALLPRFGELRTSLAIGVIWALWHLPVMILFPAWRDGVSLAAYLPMYVVGVTGLSVLMTRLWIAGRRSLVPVIWAHGLNNALAGTAFATGLWASRWSDLAGEWHFTAAIWLAAGAAWVITRRRTAQDVVAELAALSTARTLAEATSSSIPQPHTVRPSGVRHSR